VRTAYQSYDVYATVTRIIIYVRTYCARGRLWTNGRVETLRFTVTPRVTNLNRLQIAYKYNGNNNNNNNSDTPFIRRRYGGILRLYIYISAYWTMSGRGGIDGNSTRRAVPERRFFDADNRFDDNINNTRVRVSECMSSTYRIVRRTRRRARYCRKLASNEWWASPIDGILLFCIVIDFERGRRACVYDAMGKNY